MRDALLVVPEDSVARGEFSAGDHTQCILDDDTGAALGDGRPSEPMLHYAAIILGYTGSGQLVQVKISYTQNSRIPGHAEPVNPDEVMIDVDAGEFGTIRAAHMDDPDYRSTVTFAADRMSGTLDAWLNTSGTPRSDWVHVTGSWRCA